MHDRKQLNSLRLNNGMVYGNVVDYVTLLWICTNRTPLPLMLALGCTKM